MFYREEFKNFSETDALRIAWTLIIFAVFVSTPQSIEFANGSLIDNYLTSSQEYSQIGKVFSGVVILFLIILIFISIGPMITFIELSQWFGIMS